MRTQSQQTTRNLTPTSLATHRGLAYDPFEHADALGIAVVIRPLENAHEYWSESRMTVYLKSGMREAMCRVALAHGIAHMLLGHRENSAKNEHAANRYASLHLIHPSELADVEAWAPDEATVARELRVTQRILSAYRGVRA